jgi:hypothetical protein
MWCRFSDFLSDVMAADKILPEVVAMVAQWQQ